MYPASTQECWLEGAQSEGLSPRRRARREGREEEDEGLLLLACDSPLVLSVNPIGHSLLHSHISWVLPVRGTEPDGGTRADAATEGTAGRVGVRPEPRRQDAPHFSASGQTTCQGRGTGRGGPTRVPRVENSRRRLPRAQSRAPGPAPQWTRSRGLCPGAGRALPTPLAARNAKPGRARAGRRGEAARTPRSRPQRSRTGTTWGAFACASTPRARPGSAFAVFVPTKPFGVPRLPSRFRVREQVGSRLEQPPPDPGSLQIGPGEALARPAAACAPSRGDRPEPGDPQPSPAPGVPSFVYENGVSAPGLTLQKADKRGVGGFRTPAAKDAKLV